MMNHLVEIVADGGSAHAMTYGTWRLIRRGLEGGDLWFGTGWYDDAAVRTADGWRIRKRVCRVAYRDGNPLVNETIEGVKFDTRSVSLRREAEAGRVAFVEAIGR